jgi:hypothetical protein
MAPILHALQRVGKLTSARAAPWAARTHQQADVRGQCASSLYRLPIRASCCLCQYSRVVTMAACAGPGSRRPAGQLCASSVETKGLAPDIQTDKPVSRVRPKPCVRKGSRSFAHADNRQTRDSASPMHCSWQHRRSSCRSPNAKAYFWMTSTTCFTAAA